MRWTNLYGRGLGRRSLAFIVQLLQSGIGGIGLGIAAAPDEVNDNLAIGVDLDAIDLDPGRSRGLDRAGDLTLTKLALTARHSCSPILAHDCPPWGALFSLLPWSVCPSLTVPRCAVRPCVSRPTRCESGAAPAKGSSRA